VAYRITEIEGIGPSFREKLQGAQIGSTDDLLEQCGSKQGRKSVAEKTGIGEAQLLKWANMADLMRISGIAGQFAELLEAAGVDTVKELGTRNGENLSAAMTEINEQKKLAKASPSAGTVKGWITQAKEIKPRISY
jgi:predicted flap endonuclease-1-like 5' DNA nuclease